MEDLSLLRKNNIRGTYKKEVLSDEELSEAYEKVRAKYRKQGIYLPESKMKVEIEESTLAWKTTLFKKVSPELAYKEIERIKAKHKGLLTAEILLDESRRSDAVFHPCFNWNDEEAADLYRIEQARQILKGITVTILANGEPKQVRVYEVVKKDVRGIYKSIDTLNPEDLQFIRSQSLKGLTQYRNKLAVFEQFKEPVEHIDAAIEKLQETKEQVAA